MPSEGESAIFNRGDNAFIRTHPNIFDRRNNVKTLFSCLAVLLMLAAVSFAAPKERTFSGEIMDSACAKAGSQDAMMKKAGLKTAKECTEACVKNGSKYVLFNKATKKTYELDDQTKPQQFAGDKVKVKGTLDTATNTIHVVDIQAANEAKSKKSTSGT
jgi:type 1 fimbria pilin